MQKQLRYKYNKNKNLESRDGVTRGISFPSNIKRNNQILQIVLMRTSHTRTYTHAHTDKYFNRLSYNNLQLEATHVDLFLSSMINIRRGKLYPQLLILNEKFHNLYYIICYENNITSQL